MSVTAVVIERQPGGEVRLYHAGENRAFRLALAANGRRAARLGGCGGHGHPDRGIG